jgi:hypothetical protein
MRTCTFRRCVCERCLRCDCFSNLRFDCLRDFAAVPITIGRMARIVLSGYVSDPVGSIANAGVTLLATIEEDVSNPYVRSALCSPLCLPRPRPSPSPS